MKFGWFQFLIIFALALTIFSMYRIFNFGSDVVIENNTTQSQPYIKLAGREVKLELADTSIKKIRGLSGRDSLAEGEGMLFVFAEEGIYPFWMKDMNFAIDMIWINKANKVVYIEKNATPESYPKSFMNDIPASYVLEVPADFSESTLLKVGDTVEFYSK